MQESLGISISNQVIKYAKVSKNNNQINVASFGLKFYDNLIADIQQIINETNSSNIPICINTKDEKIAYFSTFGLLNKNDTKKTINTEFETMCADNHLNSNAYEGRYVICSDLLNKDRNKVIYVYDGKSDIEERTSVVKNGKIKSMTPLPISIANIADVKRNEKVLIINIEDKTTITTIINQKVYNVDEIPNGMQEVIEKINEQENSYLKAYEVCKNTTIYTMETSQTEDQNNKYLPFIVPTLYTIAQEAQKIKDEHNKIDKIYLTGLGTAINNVELYFQEYFQGTKCEILKPYFAENDSKINIKDYIEVNSAIALAMEGLDFGLKSLNFKASTWKDDLDTLLHSDIKSIGKGKSGVKKGSFKFDTNMKGELTVTEKWLLRSMMTVLVVLITFSICSTLLGKQIIAKTVQTQEVIEDTNLQLSRVNGDDTKVLDKKKDYDTFKAELEDTNEQIESKRARRNQIPTLLNQIVYIIPKNVQLIDINNTANEGKQHITITAQSKQYEQLAYFKAQIRNNRYLENVTSTEGTKENEYVVTTIEGDLP